MGDATSGVAPGGNGGGDSSGSKGSSAGGGGANFDSYIGSLISLTSKSDIRYEGVLYTIDAENCNIALQNVRSYGTEGRKKEGPQIPPRDSVYDYIIFRGSDIKDLQVKSSPQAHGAPYNDPAIIAQSQQPQKTQRMSQPVMTPPIGMPQPPSGPPPQVPSGFSHSPSLPHPPVGMPPPRDTQPMMPPGFISSSYPPAVGLGAWGPRPPPPVGNGPPMPLYWPGGYYPPHSANSMQPQYLPSQPLLPPDQRPPPQKPEFAQPSSMLPSAPPEPEKPRETATSVGMTAILTPIAKLPRLPPVSQAPVETSKPAATAVTTTEQLPVEVVEPPPKVHGNENSLQESSSQPKELQVNHATRPDHFRHEYVRPDNGRHYWRGNGRRGGRGRARTTNFTEDFDFMAMNEKFNKDEVWGELGGKSEPRNGEDDASDQWQKPDDGKKPVYVKDDFFDSLSCDALDREGGVERPRFSEQRKINTETFGDAFLRSRGRGNYRGGYRGGYRRGGRPHQAAGV